MLGRVLDEERREERTFSREPALLRTIPIRLCEIVNNRLDQLSAFCIIDRERGRWIRNANEYACGERDVGKGSLPSVMDWRTLATSGRGEALERAVYASRNLDMGVVG